MSSRARSVPNSKLSSLCNMLDSRSLGTSRQRQVQPPGQRVGQVFLDDRRILARTVARRAAAE